MTNTAHEALERKAEIISNLISVAQNCPQSSDHRPYLTGTARKLLHDAVALIDALSARAALASAVPGREPVAWQERVRHKNRGTTYRVMKRAQVQADKDSPLTDYEAVVVYECEQTGEWWVRRISEFQDGRFEKLPDEPATPVPSETQGLREAELSSDDLRLIDQAWENHKAALPVATVINNNQPGRTAIIEITIDPPTLDVGAKLYAEPKAITIATLSPAPGLVEAAEETDFDIINAEAEDANDRLSMLAQLVLNLDLGTPKGLRAKHYAQFCLGQRKDNPEGFPEPRVRARATGGSDAR